MKPATLEGGVLTIAQEAIEELARRKGIDLRLTLAPKGIEAALTVPTGIINVPAKATLERITVKKGRLVGEGLAVSSTVFPIPLSLLASFTAKYPFLALDPKQKRIYVDINQLVPGYISLNIKSIRIISRAIEIELGSVSIETLPII